MGKKVRVGVIGAGGIARGAHLPGYAKVPDEADVVAISDIDEPRARKLADDFDVPRVYADFNDMLAQEELDLVSVCTPPFMHCAASMAALNAGVNVICEKPMAMNAAEGEEMIAAANENNKMLTIGFQSRYGERAQFLKHLIEQGELGEIYFARVLALRRRGIPWWGVFVEKDKNGGGPLIDIGVHTLDLTLWLMGHPTPTAVTGAVFTKLAKRPGLYSRQVPIDQDRYTVEDFATAQIRFDTGAVINLETSWALNIENEVNAYLCGTEGGATLRPLKILKEVPNHGLLDCTPAHEEGREHNHPGQFAQVVRNVKEGTPPLVKPREALVVQQIVDAIYESGETGQMITLA
jgi:predicted dehydrogenase